MPHYDTNAPKATEQGAGLSLLEKRLTDGKQADRMEFDPTLIITIISALVPLIANCFRPKPQALRRKLLNRARVVMALRHEGLEYAQAYVEADNLFKLAGEATDAELQALIDDCCN